jgi:hypothetical protein
MSRYRVSAQISKNGIPAANAAQIRVYGMSLSLMNQLSRVGLVPTAVRKNVVSISAGDSEAGMSLAFAGVIMDAWADFQAAPDVAFNISASTGVLAAMKPVQASSYAGPTDVAVIMADLAKQMGLHLREQRRFRHPREPVFLGHGETAGDQRRDCRRYLPRPRQ